jgi:hypothetical protein
MLRLPWACAVVWVLSFVSLIGAVSISDLPTCGVSMIFSVPSISLTYGAHFLRLNFKPPMPKISELNVN